MPYLHQLTSQEPDAGREGFDRLTAQTEPENQLGN